MDKYKKDKLIKTGTFGYVWLVKSRSSGISYVLKETHLIYLNNEDRKRAFSEVAVLSECNHENIIRYKDSIVDHGLGKLYIITEYAVNGNLHNAIIKQNGVPFSESCVIFWFIQICLALQHLHNRKILHRDLKPMNIFLTRNNNVKVGDFGLSKSLLVDSEFATTSIGTPYYFSPERFQKKPYSYKSDMWALGCTLFELSALEHPFKAATYAQLISMVNQGKRRELPRWSSSLIEELVENLLKTDPTVRSSADEILEFSSLQPYISKYFLNQNSRKNAVLVSSQKASCQVACKISIEIPRKRTVSTLIPQTSEQRAVSPLKESIKVDKMLDPSHKLCPSNRKVTSLTEINNEQENTSINPSTRGVKLKHPPENVIMNVTYIVPGKSGDQKHHISNESQNNEIMTGDIDYGYQSKETNIGSSDEKINKELYLTHEVPDDLEKQCSSLEIEYRGTGSKLEDSRSFSISHLNSTENGFAHCQHGQCNQCILDTLWKNRIRENVGNSVNVKEYNKLKNKLLLLFQCDLFKKIYLSLLQDWEGKEISLNSSINNYIKDLNHEQVQNLPLMMQFVQLDVYNKLKSDENILI